MYKDLLNLSHLLSPFVVGMEGNVSKKENDTIVIKASGGILKTLSVQDLIEYNVNGEQISNFGKKGSMELNFHLYLYETFNMNYIAHTHPTNVLKILTSDKIYEFADNRMFPDHVIFNGKKSCVIPYAKPGEPLMKMIRIHLEEFIKNENFFPSVILLKNHGIIVCGNTVSECLYTTEICEKSAEIFINNFKRDFLTENEIDDLLLDDKEKYRKQQL
jgi:L-fuculose-phosphate aldolase